MPELPEPDARQKIHALIDAIFVQKSSGRTWGKITVEVTFVDGRPALAKVNDETSFKFDKSAAQS